MPVLTNAKHERFAQNLAAGMGTTEAYTAAGYSASPGAAGKLRYTAKICERLAELLGKGEKLALAADDAKKRLIAAGYNKALEALTTLSIESAADVKALLDVILNLDKDNRVVDGGVSDRKATTADGSADAAEWLRQVVALRAGGDNRAAEMDCAGSA